MSDRGFTGFAGISPPLTDRQPGSVSSIAGSALGVVTGFFEWFGNLGLFSWQVLKAAVTSPYEWRELIRQLDEVGSKSLPLVAMAGAAIGVVISLEARYSLTRFGAKSMFPATLVYSVIQVMGPVITGLVVSGRVGAGMGAELASMKVTEQIDAIEASAINPYRLLAAPRILACILMLPLLTVATDGCALMTGWFAQAVVEPLSSIHLKRIQGRYFQCIPAADIQDCCVRPDHRAHRVLSGYAHAWRRSRCRPCSHELRRTGLALLNSCRRCVGEIHSRFL